MDQDPLDIANVLIPQRGTGRPPGPGRPCLVCSHPQRFEIESDILNPDITVANISTKFEVSAQAIYRHQKSHLPHDISAALRAQRTTATDPELAKLAGIAISKKVERMGRLQETLDRLESAIQQRAEAHASAPGGNTGLIVTRQKALGSGERMQIVEEHEFDGPFVRRYLEVLAQAADEMGEGKYKSAQNSSAKTIVLVGGAAQVQVYTNSTIPGEIEEE